jgi:hypothetical protein
MYLYNSLRVLASIFGWLEREFYNWGDAIRNVWLVGKNLSHWIFAISNFFGELQDATNNIAHDWKGFYDWVIHNLGTSNVPAELLGYADDLISFIRDPFDWIADSIRDNFPELYKIANDPVSWVLETIYRYTGLDIDFVDDPRQIIRNLVHEIVGDAIEIARDPIGWVMKMLDNIIPDFWRFVYDARGWVRDRIEDEFPFLMSFLRDPDGFLEDKLVNFLEDIADRYRDRAIKLFEKVLDIIF